jgi:hypothetical protein
MKRATVCPIAGLGAGRKEAAVFLFSRPLSAVLAALALAALLVLWDSRSEAAGGGAVAGVAAPPAETCAAPGACGIVRAGS